MQSSTAVVFRALVMLACLVAIPLAAVVGKSLPDMGRRLLGGRWPARSPSTHGPLSEAPRFEPLPPAGAVPGVSAERPGTEWQDARLEDAPAWPGRAVDPGVSSVVPAGHEVPVELASGPAALGWRYGVIPRSGPEGPPATDQHLLSDQGGPSPLVPGRRGMSGPGAHRAAEGAAGPGNPAVQTPSTADQFTQIQDRLRRLGATYYRLEAWGSQQQLYRFYCRVAVGGDPNYTHYFEATDSDPFQAIARVLGQAEAWRSGRQ